jgi:hypothetical protein
MKYLVSIQASTKIPYVMLVRHPELDKGFSLHYSSYVKTDEGYDCCQDDKLLRVLRRGTR